MSFIFKVETTDEIKSAQLYCLEGSLIEGQLLIGDKAYVLINNQPLEITINSVVSINRTRSAISQNKLTLSIDKPDCDLKELEGMMMSHDIHYQPDMPNIINKKEVKKSKRTSRM